MAESLDEPLLSVYRGPALSDALFDAAPGVVARLRTAIAQKVEQVLVCLADALPGAFPLHGSDLTSS
jgi:hypothetical protein